MQSESTSQLYRDLSAKHGWPDSTYLPMILERIVTPEGARILLQLPGTTEEIAEKLSLEQDSAGKQLQELFEKGIAFSTRKGWRLNRIIDSLHDLTLINLKYWEANGGQETADLWVMFEKYEWFPVFVKSVQDLDEPLMRVLPAWEAIKDNPDRLPGEDIRQIYESADLIAEVPCCCRLEIEDRECEIPAEHYCIVLNRSAEYNLKRGVGRKLSVDEAMEKEKEVRKHKMITQTGNMTEVNMLICNCCPCCCLDYRAFGQEGAHITEFKQRSRYAPVIDEEKCTGCKLCFKTCHFDAIEMKEVVVENKKRLKAVVNSDNCIGCGNCVVACPVEGAMDLKVRFPKEHIPSNEQDIYRERY